MDWRYNGIWFDQINSNKIYRKGHDYNGTNEKTSIEDCEYAIIWNLEKVGSFDTLGASDKLLYLELNAAKINSFEGIERFKNLKRLETHYCIKLELDTGISSLKNSLQFLHINQSKKFVFTQELTQLQELRILRLNSCAPIENLDFLRHFPKLVDFRFVNTTILNGDLNPILEHPTLQSVGFLNKRHYNIKDKEVDNLLAEKNKPSNKIYAYKEAFSTFRHVDLGQ